MESGVDGTVNGIANTKDGMILAAIDGVNSL